MNPKISIVVCSYNHGAYIERTLRSILDQNYPMLELIVIDGGSKDETISILERHSDQIAYWVSEPDGGQTPALIKGFKRSTGEIQCWINSDDLMAPGCLADVARFFTTNPHAEAVFGDTTWIDSNDTPLRRQKEIPFSKFLWMYTYNYIPGMSMYWKRDLYERVGGLDPSFNLAMDADLWIRYAQVARIHHVRKNWSYMRYYPEQKNRALRDRSDAEDLAIRRRYWKSDRPPLYGTKKRIAFGLRVFLKLMNGSYAPGYERTISDPKG
jgi:glycosyltransferase involved in cell wall biosynthesis